MLSFRFMVRVSLALAVSGAIASALAPEILAKNADLVARVPSEAWEGPGAWTVKDYRIATGHSTAVDALGAAKGRVIEEKVALDDARRRLLISVLPEQDKDIFDVKGEVKAAQTAAIYRLAGRQGLFAVLVARESDVQVETKLNAARGRNQAKALMAAGDFCAAARLLGRLTELGVQDADTLDHAHAASAEVNLRLGVKGDAAKFAWAFLGEYHERHGDLEASLKARHQLYLLTNEPEKKLLEKLADLAARTHRPNSASAFRKEILQKWPPPNSKP
jgi:hypothetical protein